ncbi:MAG: hypothetical protein OEW08_12080, partial [Gammaproteobacteria bacterium]|nr:hypothetical protein [Gammaproteobacteria bacterium]
MPHISTHYSYTLVALSIAIVVIFFYIAIYLLNKFKTASDINRIALWGAALIAAFGIWSMHFVGMQAYQTPFVITYEFVRLIVSFTMIYATTIGLFTYANSDYQNIFLSALVSCLMGIGISAMHYIGMDSITIPATMAYDTDIVAFSVLYSCAISAVALYILRRLLHSSKDIPLLHLGYAALVLGAAASGMHYLGMSGTSWKPLAAANSNTRIVIDSELLTGLDIVTALLIFIAAAATLRYLSYNEIQKTRHALISIVLISLTIASLSICLIIYANNYVDRRNQLIDLVKQQANFLEAVANFDDQHSQSAHPKGAAYATLEQFVAGREKDDNISPITLSVLI